MCSPAQSADLNNIELVWVEVESEKARAKQRISAANLLQFLLKTRE